MPGFFSKIKGAFSSSPSPSRKSKNQNDTSSNFSSQFYLIKEKDLPKLHLAAWKGDFDKVVELCRPDKINFVGDGRTPIHLAVVNNHLKIVEHLINEGARLNIPDKEHRTPFILASIRGSPEMMDLLLKNNEHKNLINIPDQIGLNPLLYAIKNENFQILEVLLKSKDLNLDFQDKDKNTALHYLVIQRKLDVIDILVNHGADKNLQNADGRTPLMLASQNGDEEIIDYLLDYGADKNLKDRLGNTALNLAEMSDNKKCVDLFKEHRPVKEINLPKKSKNSAFDTETSTTDNSNKKFENIFSGKAVGASSLRKSYDDDNVKSEISSKYKVKDQDYDSDTSKGLTEEKMVLSHNKSDRVDSWDNSDEDQDSDDEHEEGKARVSNLKKIIVEGDGKFDAMFGKADLTNSKEIDSNIEININEDKIFGDNNWVFKQTALDNQKQNDKNQNSDSSPSQSSEFNVLSSFFPGSSSRKLNDTNKQNPITSLSTSPNWTIFVYTSNVKNAGTDATVHLQIFGSKQATAQFNLENKNVKDLFETGKCDKFDKSLPDIGKPIKIKIGHDNKGPFAGWHLEKVVLQNNITNEKYTFPCNRWLAKDELDHKTEVELNLENNSNNNSNKNKTRDSSISSWNSSADEEDSVGHLSPNKYSPVKQGILLKQIDEEKLNESTLSKKNQSKTENKLRGPPEISDFEDSSIDDDNVIHKNLNSTRKSENVSINLTNVTPNLIETNGSVLSTLIKNSLPKQNSTTSENSTKSGETIGKLVSTNFIHQNEKKDNVKGLADLWKNDINNTNNNNNNNKDKFKFDHITHVEDEDEDKSESIRDLIEKFDQIQNPKSANNTNKKPLSKSNSINDEHNSSIKFLIENNLVPEPSKNQTISKLVRNDSINKKMDTDSIDVFLEDIESPKVKKNETIGLLIKANLLNKDDIDLHDPKSETVDDLEAQFNEITDMSKKPTNPQSPLKYLSDSIPPPGFRNEANVNESFLLHESNSKQGLSDLLRNELKNKRIDSDSIDSLTSHKSNHNQGSAIASLIHASKPKSVSFEDSDDEIENVISQKSDIQSNHGVIDRGIGQFMSGFKDSPVSSPRKPKNSFINIIPEMLESKHDDSDETNNLLQRLKEKNEQLEKSKIDLEAQLKETENQKRSFEIAFNRLDRLLAEKEKLITQMEAEKLKNELSNSDLVSLRKELADLKEEKHSLVNKLNVLQTTSSIAENTNNQKTAGTNSLRSSEDLNLINQNEILNMKIKALENQIEELNKDRQVLADYRDELIEELKEKENDIENRKEALKIVNIQFNLEKKSLNDEITKCKKELNDLNEQRQRLERDIDELRRQLNEKNLNYEKLIIEKANYEKQFNREREDNEKMKKNYDAELFQLKEQQIKLNEKLAIAEARLLTTENDARYTSNQIDDRQKQVEDLREQLIKSKAEFNLQLNLFKREKEEKENLLKKLETMELTIKKNMEEISDLKLKSVTPQSQHQIEKENVKLQSDVKHLTEKLFKTESELEKLKLYQTNEFDSKNYSNNNKSMNERRYDEGSNNKYHNESEKILNEIQKLREDYQAILNKYSSLETSNHELNESIVSLKNHTLNNSALNRTEISIKKDPIDVSALITEVPLKTLTTLNSYLIQNMLSKEDKNDLKPPSTKSMIELGQNNNLTNYDHFLSHSKRSFMCPKCSNHQTGVGQNSYGDLLKYELSKRIELQVAKQLSLSSGFDSLNHKVNNLNSNENYDSLYNTINLNSRYSTSFFNTNNSDLLTSLRAKFLI